MIHESAVHVLSNNVIFSTDLLQYLAIVQCYAAFGIAWKFVQTTKLVRISGTCSVCFTGSDVLGWKKHTTTHVNKNNRDLNQRPLKNLNIYLKTRL